MCGRYSIYESMDHYLRQLALDLVVINGYDLEPVDRYNVAPSTRVEVIRQAEAGLHVDKVKWGWSPRWAKGKRLDPINARAETVATGKFSRVCGHMQERSPLPMAGSNGCQMRKIPSANNPTTSPAPTVHRSTLPRLPKFTRTLNQTRTMVS